MDAANGVAGRERAEPNGNTTALSYGLAIWIDDNKMSAAINAAALSPLAAMPGIKH